MPMEAVCTRPTEMPMPYDFAPRLARRALARRRRHLLFTLCLLMLPALSFHSTRPAGETLAAESLQLAEAAR